MQGLRNIPPKKLIALEFPDALTFRKAARIAATKKIPADAPGRHTLIIRKSDKKLFKDLGFAERKIADPEKIPQEELSRLRHNKPNPHTQAPR